MMPLRLYEEDGVEEPNPKKAVFFEMEDLP